jgi:PPOX class probable F420-dependent enzyme
MQGLSEARYVSLTTFRRDGTPVATPVWVVAENGLLYVWTGASTGKAKRIRNNPHVTLAECSVSGKVRGPAFDASATIIPAEQLPQIRTPLKAKYGWQLNASELSGKLSARLGRTRRLPPAPVYLELTPVT